MSWHFSLALEAEYLAESSLDGERFAPWKSMPFAPDDSCSAKMKDTFHRSPFGMMFVPLTDGLGAELLTWFLEGFLAKTSALQERDGGSRGSNLDCGEKWPESFAKFDPALFSWKIRQLWLFEDLDESLATWPKWGMMLDGECWDVATSEGCTNAIESGYLHLPTIGKNETKGSCRKRFRNSPHFRGAKMSEGLRICFDDPIYTHPRFAELIMDWPVNWTALLPLETAKFRQWLNSHGKPSASDPRDARTLARIGVAVNSPKNNACFL
jgi:hypothetical protein